MNGQEHIANSKAVKCFLQAKSVPIVQLDATKVIDASSCSTSPGSSLQSPTVSAANQKQLTLNFTPTNYPTKQKAEIVWSLKYLESDWSANSAKQISNLLKTMFSDSQIASFYQIMAQHQQSRFRMLWELRIFGAYNSR